MDPDEEPFVAAGDEESELKSKIYQTVISKRREMQIFYPLHSWEKRSWAEDKDATLISQRSKCFTTAPASGGNMKLMMFSPELFQCKEVFASATSYKENVAWRAEMGEVLQWMLARGDDSTIVAATGARNPKIRNKSQSIVFE